MTNDDIMVYEAERVLASVPMSTTFYSVEHTQQFLDHVLTSKDFVARWPRVARKNIRIKPSKRYEWAGAKTDHNTILCPSWALNDITILHELSHFCQGREKEDHGPIFCGVYLHLLKRHVSADLARKLRYSYKAYGVGYQPV